MFCDAKSALFDCTPMYLLPIQATSQTVCQPINPFWGLGRLWDWYFRVSAVHLSKQAFDSLPIILMTYDFKSTIPAQSFNYRTTTRRRLHHLKWTKEEWNVQHAQIPISNTSTLRHVSAFELIFTVAQDGWLSRSPTRSETHDLSLGDSEAHNLVGRWPSPPCWDIFEYLQSQSSSFQWDQSSALLSTRDHRLSLKIGSQILSSSWSAESRRPARDRALLQN